MNNFIGKDGYSWWVGVVENIEDPLKIGRCKIRIFGWHTENLQLLPTNDLPWAMPKNSINSASFTVPTPGDYVTGYFADGASGQNAYYDSVLPGVQSKAPDTSKGFSPQPLVPGTVAEPNAPVLPTGVVAGGVGQPTVVPVARGIVANTGISLTNSQLSHVCDFRYNFQFDIGLSVNNPITTIQNAIKNGKNNAANFIAMMIKKLNETFRNAIKAILTAMNLDPSGQLSSIYSVLKFKLQDINDFMEKVAYYVEIAASVYYLVQDIQQIVTYLQNLPDRLKAMAQDCISTFLNGAKAFAAQVAAIPGSVGNTVNNVAKSLQSSADSTLSSMNAEVSAISIPTSLQSVFSNPSSDHADTITTYISDNYANTETTMATATANNYDPTKVMWA